MSTVCEYGLFIGVDRYTNLPKDEWLTHASTDASTLCEYFRRVCPRGYWKLLRARKTTSPKQVDILTALAEWLPKVPLDRTGLFYFSGHASVSRSGLILMSFDTHNKFPQETGLPLARILEKFKEHNAHSKRFFVVLDCCRNGVKEATTDNIPPNVCILYACGHGGLAYETLKGGVLTRSIIESLEAIALETGHTRCSVRSLCNRLGRQLFMWRPSSALTYELYGHWADQIYLPMAQSSIQAVDDKRVGPSTRLRYCFGSRQDFDKAFQTLAGAIFNWYGIPYTSKGGGNFVSEHFELKPVSESRNPTRGSELLDLVKDGETAANPSENEDETQNYFFQIRIPDGCTRWTSADFLEYLLNVPLDAPQTLILTWPRKIDFSIFKEFQYAVDGEWSGAARIEGPSMTWKNTLSNSQYRGLAYVSSTEKGRTQVSVSCETINLFEMPLNYLLPGLRDVYDLFRFVRV